MLWKEYEERKIEYASSQRVYSDMLAKRNEKLAQGKVSQTLKLLKEAKLIMNERGYLLEIKREELERSADKYDRVYYLRYVKKCKINQIVALTNYSQRQVNRILRDIKDRL